MSKKPKNKLKIVLFSLLCFIAALLLIPQVLHIEQVKSEIVSLLSSGVAGRLQIGKMRWSWLPLPHLTVVDAAFESDQLDLAVPLIRLYPDWNSFRGEEIGLAKAVFTRPTIVAKTISALAGPETIFLRNKMKIIVDKGSLELQEQRAWPLNRKLKLETFSATVDVSPEAVEFNLISVPSFAGGLAIKGSYLVSDNTYELNLYTEKLKLHEALTSLEEGGRVIPVESEANLKARIQGTGWQEVKADILGELPCLLVKPEDKKLLVTCGFADMSLDKKGAEFSLEINNLEIREPAISLSGRIQKYLPRDEAEPHWLIDLNGRDADLSQLREAVLTLWKDHPVTQIVTSIVLGGTAGKAGYRFDGPVADFEDIRNMTITAEDILAEIHVPEAELDLREANARMLIRDGNLILNDASARYRNSRGRNCTLLLGLTEEDHTFELDLDIDADLADLPETLLQLVDQQSFQEEVKKFSKVSGSATGHLHLGDHLEDIAFDVSAEKIMLHADYQGLNWEFQINAGSLRVTPDAVSWQDIAGSLGPHRIWRGNGEIHWEDDVQLRIRSLDAFLSAPALAVEDFAYFPELKQILDENLDFLDGLLRLSNTTLTGAVRHPEKWEYQSTVNFDDLVWESPFLPGRIVTEKGLIEVSNDRVEIAGFAGRILGDSMALQGSLQHHNFSDWQGALTLSGSVHEELARWLKKKDWISPVFFPRIPFNLQGMTYSWHDQGFSLKGTLIPGEEIRERPRLELSYRSTSNDPVVMELDLLGEKERGMLAVDFLDNLPDTFELSWQGAVSGKTIAAIFEEQELLQGTIQGALKLNVSPDPRETFMEGDLEVDSLRWYWPGNAFNNIVLKDLQVSGKGKEAYIEKLTVDFQNDESVSMGGNVLLSEEGLKIDFDLTSPSLSILTVVGFLSDLAIQKDLVLTDEGKNGASLEAWTITGHVDFNITEFISGDKATPENKLKTSTLVWTPLVGSFVLHPQGKLAAEITSGRLCCLSATGKWFSDPTMDDNSFTITSDCPEPALFENILPCLGFDQDLIVGEFDINANLRGQINNWKSGSVTISSDQGRILRLRALSNIFKVVNLTDLFTAFEYSGMTDKGFAYNQLLLDTVVKDNRLIIEKGVVRGEGLNLFTRGNLDLGTLNTDIVVMIAPLKTLDAIVAKVPLVGRVVGGENATVITIPVGIKGDIRDPEVTVLPPSAVGEGILSIVKNALMLPFHILSPILPDKKDR